jgi:hypothetical protein
VRDTRQFCRGLSKSEVAEADLADDAQGLPQRRVIGQALESGIDRHSQDIGDRLVADLYFQRLGVVARALASGAGRVTSCFRLRSGSRAPLLIEGADAVAIGDTHGLLRPEAEHRLSGVD